MIRLAAIAAIGSRGELGLKGDMPWGRSLKEDLKFFRKTTAGKPVIMGYRTWKSLPKALPGRENLVITSHEINDPNVRVFSSIPEVLDYLEAKAKKTSDNKTKNDANENPNPTQPSDLPQIDAFVIGGGSIYKAMLEDCQDLILTEIDSTFDADTWFPKFNPDDYTKRVLDSNEENGFSYRHILYQKKDANIK